MFIRSFAGYFLRVGGVLFPLIISLILEATDFNDSRTQLIHIHIFSFSHHISSHLLFPFSLHSSPQLAQAPAFCFHPLVSIFMFWYRISRIFLSNVLSL